MAKQRAKRPSVDSSSSSFLGSTPDVPFFSGIANWRVFRQLSSASSSDETAKLESPERQEGREQKIESLTGDEQTAALDDDDEAWGIEKSSQGTITADVSIVDGGKVEGQNKNIRRSSAVPMSSDVIRARQAHQFRRAQSTIVAPSSSKLVQLESPTPARSSFDASNNTALVRRQLSNNNGSRDQQERALDVARRRLASWFASTELVGLFCRHHPKFEKLLSLQYEARSRMTMAARMEREVIGLRNR
jgi:hypothetical protein